MKRNMTVSEISGLSPSESSLTKAELIDAVYHRSGGFSKREAAELVDTTFDIMKEHLAAQDGDPQSGITRKVKLSGFGNFVVRAKKERRGRNPQTGDSLMITARRVLTFQPSQLLKNLLNPDRKS